MAPKEKKAATPKKKPAGKPVQARRVSAQQKAAQQAAERLNFHVNHAIIASLVVLVAAFSCFGYIVEDRSVLGGTIAAAVFGVVGLGYSVAGSFLRSHATRRKLPYNGATAATVFNGFAALLCSIVSLYGLTLLG